jgi:hypothetical protein
MPHTLYGPFEDIYWDAAMVEEVTAKGRQLVSGISTGQISREEVVQRVQSYLEEHGRAIGSPLMSEQRLAFYNNLEHITTVAEIATHLEQLIDVFCNFSQRLTALNQAAAAAFAAI